MELPPPVQSPLRIIGLTKTYGTTVAIDQLTLEVPPGACYGLVGPNGSGKSTTMRAVVGLVRPDAGMIEVCGVRVDQDVLATRRSMGVMLDPLQLFDRLTAWEFIETIGALRELDADFVRAATGQPIGGVAPVGHPRPLRTVVDVELARYPVVWAAGGHPHYVFPTTYDELLRITAGEAAEVGEQPA